MKKGLSVLLIAAALFGFYGGAVSINDVLACKDYWEKEGEKSTADMNKLEDGLNQLKDNEQAYLDGLETLAEGEKTLADGEAKLADGEAQYAQGLADYKAAPGKLADAEKKLAAGRAKLADAEDQLAEGKEKLSGLTTLIAGINNVRSSYATWKNGYDELHKNRKALAGGVAGNMAALSALADQMGNQKDAYETALGGLNDNDQYADGYRSFAANGRTVAACVDGLKSNLETLLSYADQISSWDNDTIIGQLKTSEQMKEVVINVCVAGGDKPAQAKLRIKNATGEDTDKAIQAAKNIRAKAKDAKTKLSGSITQLTGLQTNLTNNLVAFASAVDKNVGSLDGGQDQLANGVATIASNVLGNKDLKEGVKNKFGQAAIALLQQYSGSSNPLSTKVSSFELFETQMDSTPGIDAFLLKASELLASTKADGIKTYNAGLKEYNQGKADYKAGLAKYNQGLADYKAAPAKLADAEKQLADGRQQLADGRQQLADGKKKLAEYEDGEQQVRDGLATLMGTEADLDLESILDRRNGDDEFDDANGHLQLNEGLDAVKTGREYQSDDGVLITKEITARAIGTVGCLAAAALAILAGVLSLLKKYKAAAVSAVLTAIAGAVGIAQGMSAGEYFSSIAGSTVGNTPFIAAGVLAAVAAVFAIVNFTAKKEEA